MMKIKLLLIATLSAFIWSCNQTATPNQQETKQSVYGESFDPTQAIDQSQLSVMINGNDTTTVKFKAEIVETCAKAGCWMTVKNSAGYPMYVFMKDHDFAVPKTGAIGHQCIVNGRLYRDTLSVEIQKHFAEDAGLSEDQINAITSPLPTLAVEATGVIIEGIDPSQSTESTEEKEHGH
jgi:hypothetical protein